MLKIDDLKKYITNQKITEADKISKLFNIKTDYVNDLLSLGFDFDVDYNRFFTDMVINDKKYNIKIHWEGDIIISDILKITINEENQTSTQYHKTKKLNNNSISLNTLILFLEHFIKTKESEIKKSFNQYVESTKANI